MMHADLIDQDDLLGQLRALGFEMPAGASAEPVSYTHLTLPTKA